MRILSGGVFVQDSTELIIFRIQIDTGLKQMCSLRTARIEYNVPICAPLFPCCHCVRGNKCLNNMLCLHCLSFTTVYYYKFWLSEMPESLTISTPTKVVNNSSGHSVAALLCCCRQTSQVCCKGMFPWLTHLNNALCPLLNCHCDKCDRKIIKI